MLEFTLPKLIEMDHLAQLQQAGLPDNIVLVDLSNKAVYEQAHIQKAIHVPYQLTQSGIMPAVGKLPSLEQLTFLFGMIGYTGTEHFIVYDDEGGGWAGRFIWLLDVIGHTQYSYLNGGLRAWLAAGLPLEKSVNTRTTTTPTLTIDTTPIATVDEIVATIGNPDTIVWDARSEEEFLGIKVLAQKGGHIPGAVNYEWVQGIDTANGYRIKASILTELKALGITPNKRVITHCQAHHRSGFSYLVARLFEFPHIKAYDGSWSEWGNLAHTPVELNGTTTTP